jgi:hypothetical protein
MFEKKNTVSRRMVAGGAMVASVMALLAGRSQARQPASEGNANSSGNSRITATEVAHRIAIDDLLTRYTIAVDDEDFDLLDTVFTPDAILDYTSAGGPRGPYPEIKAWLSAALSTGNPARQHLIANRQVLIEGSTARVRAYFFNPFTLDTPDGGIEYSLGGGYYNHLLRLGPEGWRSVELFELRVWRQGKPPRPHPHNARSKEIWNFGAPPRPKT